MGQFGRFGVFGVLILIGWLSRGLWIGWGCGRRLVVGGYMGGKEKEGWVRVGWLLELGDFFPGAL